MIRSIWKSLSWLSLEPAAARNLGLHSRERIRAILERERMRSDRGNAVFTLLTLSFPEPINGANLNAVAAIVRQRIRVTDDAGLLEPDVVALVLPETRAEGAWKLADDLAESLALEFQRPKCDVYEYPTTPSHGHSSESKKHVTCNGASDRVAHGASDAAHVGNGALAFLGERRAQSMASFFVRPLPKWKRTVDVLVAGLGIALTGPLMLAVAVAIKLTSRGPVIFKQRRDTLGGRQFMIYKFRTMAVDAEQRKAALLALSEQDGPAFKITKDPRVTWLGRFLRVTSIDELPQFFNVLAGDMTLVGPRAMDSNESSHCDLWQRRRLDVTAGITCIWQVRGRSRVSFAEWMRMDLRYIRGVSMAGDLKLIAQTVPAALTGRGAC